MNSNYYQNYIGPVLIKATLNKEDITLVIQKIYGHNNNWQGKLWKYKDILNNSIGKNLYCEFQSTNKRIHWFNTIINNENHYLNSAFATPMNQI